MRLKGGVLALSVSLCLAASAQESDAPPAAPSSDPGATPTAGTATEPGHKEEPDDARIPVVRARQPRAPAAAVIRDNFVSVQVNVDAAGDDILGDAANEPSMAIDPTDPNNVVIGWRQFDTVASNFRQAGYAYSHDGGTTWTFPGVLEPGQFRSDPVLAADSQGRFYYYSLSSTTNAEMFVSADKGVSWLGPVPAFGGDKTWMAADTTGGTGNDNVYTIWNSQFTCCGFNTDFTRSSDGGMTFDGPYAMPSKAKWGTVDVSPDGDVFVAGTRTTISAFPDPHLVLRSSNAQMSSHTPSFDEVTGIALGGMTTSGGTPNPGGLLGQIWVAVDRSTGPTRGNIYVLASVDPPGTDPMDVMLVRSADGGATFSAPIRVNGRAGDAWQWFGTMSVAPDGRIDVVWNDTRDDPSGRTSELYYAYSTDSGQSWSDGLPVTPAWDSTIGYPNQNKIGDYYHMVSDTQGAALAYAATFRGGEDIYFLRVGDCNADGQHDSVDISTGASDDCDYNGIPDDCQAQVHCLTCNDDGTCQRGESCESCPNDCSAGSLGCGNGICELAIGEDCLSCPSDCNGVQKGSPGNRFCCGDGDGTNPVGCADARCTANGLICSSSQVQPTCCGDGFCEGTEDELNCFADCVVGTPGESSHHDVAADQMRVAGYDEVAGRVDLIYTPACDATQHTIYGGQLTSVSSYGYSFAACNVGTSGSAAFVPGPDDAFFVIVGNDGTREGSYGTDGGGIERPEATGTPGCDLPQNLSAVVCE